jgi:Tannase and feruloyl esterase
VIIWHGWNDQLIFPQGSIDYYERVLAFTHNVQPDQDFARLFMAPGVFHCGGGTGPSSFDMFGALVNWVENGVAPDRIVASQIVGGSVVRTRPLCPYPKVARYNGTGDTNSAASFTCS